MVVDTEVQSGSCVKYSVWLSVILLSKKNHKYWFLFAVFTRTITSARKKT